MQTEHQLVKAVYAAKEDSQKADALLEAYTPFIRSEVHKLIPGAYADRDDDYSVAMMAFYEAILNYEKDRGAFLYYAAKHIRSRLIDHRRKESRHSGHLSLEDMINSDDGRQIKDILADTADPFEVVAARNAAQQEIGELSKALASFGISFSDVADNAPKQRRTLESCVRAARYGAENRDLLKSLLETKKLPMTELAKGTGVSRKTLERHRKYILALFLIQSNGYETIRGHIRQIINRKEAASK